MTSPATQPTKRFGNLTFALERAAIFVERWRMAVLAGISLAFLAIGYFTSVTKLLWFGELGTYYPARQSWHDLVDFFMSGQDVFTPVNSLIAKASMVVFGDDPFGLRAPYIAAFLLFCVCLYRLVSRRVGPLWGFVAMTLPMVAALYYATE